MACKRSILALTLLILVSGCGQDLKSHADQMVADEYLKAGKHVKAIPFFEAGGKYFDQDEAKPSQVDQKILLPMLKDLYQLHPGQQWVVPDTRNAKVAFAVLIELPGDAAQVDAMAKIVEAADDKFDGKILQQWGHKWLSVDLIDQETAEFFRKSDPDFDKQR
jgi:hypothetical protein